jgi:hypothetical protein
VKTSWRDCAFPQPISAWQLDHRGDILFQCMHFVTIVKSVLKSRFCAISFDFNDFTRFQLDFTHFLFFQMIQHVKHVLTRKIIRFYESKCDFNNLGSHVNYMTIIPSFFVLFLRNWFSGTTLKFNSVKRHCSDVMYMTIIPSFFVLFLRN